MTFDVAIPVYNAPLNDIPAVKALADCPNVTIYICDNSTDEFIKKKNEKASFAGQAKLVYMDMGGNSGLPKAYNRALTMSEGDVFGVFDDDTEIPKEFIALMSDAIQKNGSGAYFPLVYSGTALLSPLRGVGPAIVRVRDTNSIKQNNLFAFNTGAVFTKDIVKNIRYDESLFLEFVDFAFCRDLRNAGVPLHLVNTVILNQNYSVTTNSLQAALHRDRIGRADVRTYYSKGLINKLYGSLYLFYRLLRNSLRYKTTAFFTMK